MTDRRRPATASRWLAGGLSTAATLGLTAGFALTAPPPAPAPPAPASAPAVAAIGQVAPQQPARRVVVVRRHVAGAPAAEQSRPDPVLADAAPAPAPPASQPAPTTTSSGS